MQKLTVLFLISLGTFFLCNHTTEDTSLYQHFMNPSAEARPMVRWWWNGNAVEAEEIKRELGVLKKAGIGGIEINSIAMPPHAKQINAKPLQWAGPEWCQMVKIAAQEARKLGMITDLIVGSGWPFGGKFLKQEEIMQRLGIKKQNVKANSTIDIHVDEFLTFKTSLAPGDTKGKNTSDVELQSVKLVPVGINHLDEIIDITSEVKGNQLRYQVDHRNFVLVFVYLERNFKMVYHGSPGADGPIMDHYKTEAVQGYLNRLKAIEKETGIPLAKLIRALFCDSIELSGSNWTDDMADQFELQNGYDIRPWLPFVIQPPNQPNRFETTASMAETLKRVQYDFYHTIINIFLDRFTRQFQKFCTDNGVLCRYQAYGTPYYMGLFQGYMIPDIPESNNWIYSGGRDEAEHEEFTWVQGHGYMLWNKAASSAANIQGRKITSCEAITNTRGVFRTSLETIKQSDDMNFITGMNHAVLHGFNYSPPAAGFPGWVRYGAYFSEQNTWWKFIKSWSDYNARLSAVFQNSRSDVDIAVLGPLRDFWGKEGLARPPFNLNPWYYARLWEAVSNLGSSLDYIHHPVLENASVKGKELICGQMRYKALILADVESLTPEAAEKLREFGQAGGKIIIIGKVPSRSLSYVDATKNDFRVKFAVLQTLEQENVIEVAAPAPSDELLGWTQNLFRKMSFKTQVEIKHPKDYLYFMSKKKGDQELFFFVNSNRKKPVEFEVMFPTGDKVPYIWLPSTGERFVMSHQSRNTLNLKLNALESALVIYEPDTLNLPTYQYEDDPKNWQPLETNWQIAFEHINGQKFSEEMDKLIDFKTSDKEAIRTFAGTVSYAAEFENLGTIRYVKLANVHEGVSELMVNGKNVGMQWYGNHIYDIQSLIKPGTNHIQIKLTNTLANYCGSLTENPTARAWTGSYETPVSSGLVGVELGE